LACVLSQVAELRKHMPKTQQHAAVPGARGAAENDPLERFMGMIRP
jgi:hypothetical protein